jgi:hypothetical protein
LTQTYQVAPPLLLLLAHFLSFPATSPQTAISGQNAERLNVKFEFARNQYQRRLCKHLDTPTPDYIGVRPDHFFQAEVIYSVMAGEMCMDNLPFGAIVALDLPATMVSIHL